MDKFRRFGHLTPNIKAITHFKADAQKAKDVVRVLRDAKERAVKF